MFFNKYKEEILWLQKRTKLLMRDLDSLINAIRKEGYKILYDPTGDAGILLSSRPTASVVDCETCGCQIKKENAIAGEPFIRQRGRWVDNSYYGSEDYIHYPYYCKKCAPKKKTTKK